MFFYIIALICSIVAGMGIGGGSIFILLSTIFNLCDFKEAQIYNLIMFIFVGISSGIVSIKNKEIDFLLFKKIIFFIIIGSVIGVILNFFIKIEITQKIFLGFMCVLGIYEIISSLKNIILTKNNTNERR